MFYKHPRCRKCIAAAGTDGKDAVVRLDDFPGSRHNKRFLVVQHRKECLKLAQVLVSSPLLCKLYCSTLKVTVVLIKIIFKLAEKHKRICCGAGKSSKDGSVVEFPGLLGMVLHHRLPDGDLAVGAHDSMSAIRKAEDGRSSDTLFHDV